MIYLPTFARTRTVPTGNSTADVIPRIGCQSARWANRVEERRGGLGRAATLRFLPSHVEPYIRFRIRISDKTSGLRSRQAMCSRSQFYETKRVV
jgi:hypothetical protein